MLSLGSNSQVQQLAAVFALNIIIVRTIKFMYNILYCRPFLCFSYVRGAKESRSSAAREKTFGRKAEAGLSLLFDTSPIWNKYIPVTASVSLNHATSFLSMQHFSCEGLSKVMIRYKNILYI